MPHQCTSCGHVFADGSKEMLSGCPDCGGTKFQFHPEGTEIPDSPDPDAEPPDPPTPDDSVTGAVGNAAATVKDLVGRGGSSGPPEDSPATENSPTASENVGGVALETEASTPGSTAAGTDEASGQAAPTEPPARPTATDAAEIKAEPTSEDSAQADARSDIVSPDELPDTSGAASESQDAHATESSTDHPTAPTTEQPDTPTPPAESGPDQSIASETGASTDSAGQATSAGTTVDGPDEDDDRPDLSELRKELNEQFESIKVVEPGQYELNLMELYDREEYIIALEEDGKYSIQVPDRWQD